MDLRKIKKLIEMLQESDLNEIEVKEGEESVRINRKKEGIIHASNPSISEKVSVPTNDADLVEPLVLILRAPVIVPPASGSFVAILFVTVVLKLASSFKAAASSSKVFSAAGADATKFATAVSTYAVVATLVELSLADCVVVVGLPASATLACI